MKPRMICAEGAAARIDENLVAITKDLDAVQTKTQALAQGETLGGDIELVTSLLNVSFDAARLEQFLPCPQKANPKPLAPDVAGGWLKQVREIREQAAEDASKLQTESTAPARRARAEEERVRWQVRDVVELAKALVWPSVLVLALIVFRKPMSRFVEQIAGKITKVSLFEVAIELATVPSTPTPWLDPNIYAGSELFGGAVTTTTIMDLFKRIRDDVVWNYLIVDLEEGQAWLESRLYLFTIILQRMGGLRCVVFVSSAQGLLRGFLGLAEPGQVQRALADKNPWFQNILDKAAAEALAENNMPLSMLDPMPKKLAEAISNKFIFDPNMQVTVDPKNLEWSQLGSSGSWDHSRWLTLERFNKNLRSAIFDVELSQFEDTPDTPPENRTRAVLRRRLPFVALVNQRGEFKRLIDRQVVIEQVAAKLGDPTSELVDTTAKKE